MFRLPFAKRPEEADVEELKDPDEMWALPDMEAAPPSPAIAPEQQAAFQLEDQEVHPAGSFEAVLASWRQLPNDRVAWGFQVTPDSARQRSGAPLEFVTGAAYRQDNHLCRLLSALGAVAPPNADELHRAETRSELERLLSQLKPDSLIGRRCRIEVAQARDELGNVVAQVSNVAPLGHE